MWNWTNTVLAGQSQHHGAQTLMTAGVCSSPSTHGGGAGLIVEVKHSKSTKYIIGIWQIHDRGVRVENLEQGGAQQETLWRPSRQTDAAGQAQSERSLAAVNFAGAEVCCEGYSGLGKAMT